MIEGANLRFLCVSEQFKVQNFSNKINKKQLNGLLKGADFKLKIQMKKYFYSVIFNRIIASRCLFYEIYSDFQKGTLNFICSVLFQFEKRLSYEKAS